MSASPVPIASATTDAPVAMPHPSVFLALFLPYGLTGGFLSVTLAYQLARKGVPAGDIAGLVALSLLPQTWKFLWAPLVDTTLTRKRWYTMSALCCGLGMVAAGVVVDRAQVPLGALAVLLLAGNFAVTLLSMAVEGLMAVTVPDSHRGRVGGWFQAGNLGGVGLGGGLALWLVQAAHWSAGAAGGALLAACAACCLVLPRLREPVTAAARHLGVAAHARDMLAELWGLARSRPGALALLICFLPIGSGAAQNLWAAVADDWHAGADTVALVNGALGGVVSAVGCLAGGWICDRIDRKTAYCLFGAALVAAALAMALLPRTPAQFIAWTSIYAFIQGLCYAGFTAIALEAVGRVAAATKYSLIASLSNMPVAWVILVDGHANDRWGTRGMLFAEALCGAAGILLFVAMAGATRKRADIASPQAAAATPA